MNGYKDAGLVGEQTASIAAGFDKDEHISAREDHTDRVFRIAEAQGKAGAARGVPDADDDPAGSGRREKELSRATDNKDSTKKPVRGNGR